MKYESFAYTTVDGLLAAQAVSHHDRPFFRFADECLTYRQVERQAATVAAGLRELGLQPGDRLAVILPNIPAFGVVLFASVKAGLILVPVNIRRGRTEVMARLFKTRPKALVTFADPDLGYGVDHLDWGLSVQSELPTLKHVISLEGDGKKALLWSDLLGATAPPAEVINKPEDPAAIVHTLGSFGDPRGAILTHGGLTRNAASMASVLRCQPEDVFLGAVPFSNTFGLTATILAAAAAGAQVVCLPKYHPAKAITLIAEERITVHHGVPTMFAMELNHPDFSPELCASLRTGIMSGAPCPPMLVKRVREEMNCNVVLAYGLTETCPAITMTHLDDGPVTSTETVGRPIDGVELKVVSPEGAALPAGEEGELCVRGYNVMLGYWDDPEATVGVLDADGWLRTGDLAVLDPDGPVRIVGRIDEVVIRGGFKIYPGMVEMVLRSFSGVKETAVLGVPDMIFGELLVACVVCQPGQEITAAELMSFASEHLAEYALPDRILFFDALPRRGSGPVQKDYLRSRVRIRGRAWKFGRNVDTDAIIPARHCNTADPRQLAEHCMEDADPNFVRQMRRGDLIVADSNFGCGSSREVAPLTIKAAGVSAVVAKSFARIFFRNAINIGLPILECPEAVNDISEGDEIEVEPATGSIRNLTHGTTFQATPFPDFLQQIIDRGGLLAYVEERLAAEEPGEALEHTLSG